jgi:hypothetical protein
MIGNLSMISTMTVGFTDRGQDAKFGAGQSLMHTCFGT